MRRICVVTSKSKAYYSIVSRLRRAGLPFSSLVPGSDCTRCGIILTTAEEAGEYGDKGMAFEDLDENPGVFKGQVVSKLVGPGEMVFVGVDPGKRTGLAVFYGQTKVASGTFESATALLGRIGSFATRLPESRFVVRIGNGNRGMAVKLAEGMRSAAPGATIEIVDESGTSARSSRMIGLQGDQGAAAKIAFRRGEVVSLGNPRIQK